MDKIILIYFICYNPPPSNFYTTTSILHPRFSCVILKLIIVSVLCYVFEATSAWMVWCESSMDDKQTCSVLPPLGSYSVHLIH